MASDRTWAGAWAAAAALPLLVTGNNLLVLPAVLVGLGGIILGIRGLRRSSDAAATPLGVAVVAAVLVAVPSVLTGDLLLALSGLAAAAMLGLSWARVLAGRSAEHAAWAERFGRAQERDRERSRRHDARLRWPPPDG